MLADLQANLPHGTLALADFAEVLEWLHAGGFEFAVIGGQAVAAYADLLGETCRSLDLDLYVSESTLEEMLARAAESGIRIAKRPQPRSLPVAVLVFGELEVNALTSSSGLLPPEVIARTARRFEVSSLGLEIPVADPFDLLENKLAVARDKDRPHITILDRFVENEAVEAFRAEQMPRARLAPARRLLEVRDLQYLPGRLFSRLLAEARLPTDFKFLVSRAPNRDLANRALSRCDDPDLRALLAAILVGRGPEEQDPG